MGDSDGFGNGSCRISSAIEEEGVGVFSGSGGNHGEAAGDGEAGCLGPADENAARLVVAGGDVGKNEIAIVGAAPSEIEMEVVVGIVAVAHEGMPAARAPESPTPAVENWILLI